MLLPAQYAWFEPVLIASIVVFVIDLIGNSITFSNRYSPWRRVAASEEYAGPVRLAWARPFFVRGRTGRVPHFHLRIFAQRRSLSGAERTLPTLTLLAVASVRPSASNLISVRGKS